MFRFGRKGTAQLNIVNSWPTTSLVIDLDDVNVDGFVDLKLHDIGAVVPGGLDQIAFSSGEVLNLNPKGQLNITADKQQFFDEFSAWVDNPDYYEENAVWVPGYWDESTECEWVYYESQDVWQFECTIYTVYNYGYWSYDHLNDQGRGLAGIIEGVLAGDPLASIGSAVDVLENVLGVEIGGWDFGIPLPGGIDATFDASSLVLLVIASTQDVETGQTPQCILSDLQGSGGYHGRRVAQYLSPQTFNPTINNYLTNWRHDPADPLGVYNTEGMVTDGSWNVSPRYTWVDGFGWFDARHATLGFGIQYTDGAIALALFESTWENLQGVQGRCQSANIREDIFSNRIGAIAADAYEETPSISQAEHMRNAIGVSLLSQTGAIAALVAEGITITP